MTERTVRFEQIRNDLFWTLYDVELGKSVTWQGYNDYFWWKYISNTDDFQVRGKYRLDPDRCTVSIIEDKE